MEVRQQAKMTASTHAHTDLLLFTGIHTPFTHSHMQACANEQLAPGRSVVHWGLPLGVRGAGGAPLLWSWFGFGLVLARGGAAVSILVVIG
jgi:hypothetical protein